MRGLRRQPVAEDPRRSQSLDSHDNGSLPPLFCKMWAVREEAHSFSVTPVSCVTKRVEDIMPALQAYHARKRELQCVATESVQKPGSSPDLLMVQDCTEQSALAMSYDKLRALLANQPQCFALTFSITEIPPFALLRSGSKVMDATVHIRQEIFFCKWLRLFDVAATSLLVLMILTFIVTQHLPKLSESCASTPEADLEGVSLSPLPQVSLC